MSCRFVLGIEDIEEGKQDKIIKEAKLYDDIIYFTDVKNSYSTLTDRIVRVFQYIITEQQYNYVLKCDDDTIPDVRRIATELQNRENPGRFYWGGMNLGHVLSKGIWRETKWSACQTYYPYAYGGGYILSWDLVQLMVESVPYLKRYNSEDVSVGSWLSAYNIERKHDTRFTTGASARGCKSIYLMVHKVSRENMYGHYTSLVRDGSICGPTNSWNRRSGFIYNWTALPPSKKCCVRRSGIP